MNWFGSTLQFGFESILISQWWCIQSKDNILVSFSKFIRIKLPSFELFEYLGFEFEKLATTKIRVEILVPPPLQVPSRYEMQIFPTFLNGVSCEILIISFSNAWVKTTEAWLFNSLYSVGEWLIKLTIDWNNSYPNWVAKTNDIHMTRLVVDTE